MKDKLIGPNRRTIEALFRDLSPVGDDPNYVEYQRLTEEIDDLAKEFEETPKMRSLRKLKDAAYKRFARNKAKKASIIQQTRQLYYAKGIVPVVLKAVEKMLKELAK